MTTKTITITINSAVGFDTRYLFPGSVPHIVDSASDDLNGTLFNYRTVTNAYPAPVNPIKLGTHFAIEPIVPYLHSVDVTNNGHDLSGDFVHWSIQDKFDSSHAALAAVSIAGGTSSYIEAHSFGAVTPDSLVSTELSAGQDVKIILNGGNGNDTLRGSFWDDTLDGKKGADAMIGGDGSDNYWIDNAGDKVIETANSGYDFIHTKYSTTLSAYFEAAYATGSGKVNFTGNAAGNTFTGNSGANILKGMAGSDFIRGADGHDMLFGGSGNDYFEFVTPASGSNWDTVRDFRTGDKIVVSQFAHIGLTTYPGTLPVQSYTAIGVATFYANKNGKAHDSNDRIVYDTDDGKLYFDADGNGSGAAKMIALITDHPTLHYYDILIL